MFGKIVILGIDVESCLCWVDFASWFQWLSPVLRRVQWLCVGWQEVLLVASYMCGHLGFQVKCVSRYWQLTLRNTQEWDWARRRFAEVVHRRKKTMVFHQHLLSPLGMGAESEQRMQQVVFNRAGDEAGRLELENQGRGEDSQSTCLAGQSSLFIPREYLLELGAGIKQWGGGEEV